MKKNVKNILALGLVCLVISLILINLKPSNETKDSIKNSITTNMRIEEIQTEEKTKEEVNVFLDSLFSQETTLSSLEDFVESPLNSSFVYYGSDSYIRELGDNISGVADYDVKRDEYATQLEEIIKNNFDVSLDEYVVSADNMIVQRLTYRTYYYNSFIRDFDSVYSKLVSFSDINESEFENRSPTEEELEKIYKLKVKALELMSNHFDDYINKDEYLKYELIYKIEENEIKADYLSLVIFLAGELYEAKPVSSSSREERVNDIVNSAISSGKLDINNPYKLN